MRDYPNGGFFFIDAAPIQAAGENGLKIDGIFEDAKRAVEGGKVFVMTNFASDESIVNGVMTVASETDTLSAGMSLAETTVSIVISPEDVVKISTI